MSRTNVLVWIASLAGLGASAFLAGTVPRYRFGGPLFATAALCIAAAYVGHRSIEVGAGWTAGALAVSAAFALAWGRAARLLAHLLLPAWALGALAVHRSTPATWEPVLGAGALVFATLFCFLVGVRASPLRERIWFVDLTLLALLAGLSLLAGPAALMAWRRAGVAAEGQDPASLTATPLWPLAAGAAAFVAGAAWRFHRARSGHVKGL